jgi:cytochrome b
MEWQTPEVATSAPTAIIESEARGREWQQHEHDVSLTHARELIARSKRANPGQPAAGAITRVALDALLAQDGCAGVRMYYGQNEDGNRTLVLVAMDEFGNDLDEGLIMDYLMICPPFCAMNSALDS